MTPAQLAQQNNRDGAGRYAEQALADPGSQVLLDERELIRDVTTSRDPLTVQLATGTAAALLRDREGDPAGRLTQMAETQAEHVTMLVADNRLRSLYLVEGRIADVEDGIVAMWPKGLRTRGFRFPLGWIRSVRDGYGRTDEILHDLASATATVVPQLDANPHLDRLPGYTPSVHDADNAPVVACYLMRHRDSSDQPFTQGCVLAAVAGDTQHVYGYLWTPEGSGIARRYVRTNPARVAAMSARISTYRPGQLTVADCAALPGDRTGTYSRITAE